MEYCDLLASLIQKQIKDGQTPYELEGNAYGVAFFGVKSKLDLHPEHGYLLSTNKFITCRDNKGNSYRITVEANPVASLDDKLAESNSRHSRNGDPVGHCVESVATKLSFALQDPTVLAEITDAELEVLVAEVKAAQEAKETRGEVINGSF